MSAITTATIFGSSFEEAVHAVESTGLYSRAAAEETVTKARKERILQEYHRYKISQNKNGIWWTKVPNDNPDAANKTKKKQSADRDKLELMVAEHYLTLNAEKKPEALTLKKLFEEWIEDRAEIKATGTVKKFRQSWNRYYVDEPLSQPIINATLKQLQDMDLEKYALKMIKKHHMTAHTWGNFSGVIRQMLAYARREKLIPGNPWDFVNIRYSDVLFEEEEKTRDEQIIIPALLDDFIDHAWTQYREQRQSVQIFVPLAIVFMVNTGLRVSEVSALKFHDIDGDFICVQRMYNYMERQEMNKLKKGSKRKFELSDAALEVIEEVKRKRLELGMPINDYIFAVNDPRNTYTSIQKMVPKYCEDLELYKHSAHDTRRTYISIMLQFLPPKAVMEMTGHKNYACFEKHYVYDTETSERKKNALNSAFKTQGEQQ